MIERWLNTIENLTDHRIGLVGLGIAILTLLATAVGVYLPWRDSRRNRKKESGESKLPFDADLRLRLLGRVQELVESGLRQGLRNAIRVDLGLTEMPSAVPAGLKEYAVLESGALEERPAAGSVEQVFEQSGRQLLILGEPGAGKTNLLLELAASLIGGAKNDNTFPIPVVLSLPGWTLRKTAVLHRSLASWIEDELVDVYGLAPAGAEALIRQDRIVPLLDGLDEVAEKWRADCVEEIRSYQKNRNLGPMAVCCRLAEYETLPRLELGAAIRVEKLTRHNVEREISKPGLEYVRRALELDPGLWDILDAPLWLHVLYGAAQADGVVGDPSANPRDRLYARYVEYAIRRTAPDSPRARTSRDSLLHWLGALAEWMKRGDQVDFVVGDLDYLWLLSRQGAWTGTLLQSAIAGLIAGSIGGPDVGLVVGLGGVALNVFQPVWTFYSRWRFDLRGRHVARDLVGLILSVFLNALAYGLAAAVIGGLDPAHTGSVSTWRIGWVAAVCSAFSGVLWLIRMQTLLWRVDRRTFGSFRYTLWNCVQSLAPLLLFVPIFGRGEVTKIAFALTAGWACSGLVSFAAGHYVVLLWLRLRGLAPLRYPRFLTEGVERLFLIRRGESFGFFHVTFRDYMAGAHGPKSQLPSAIRRTGAISSASDSQ
ncbi:MAG TPA: NACHT domain-containing protein [Bryobacteraceae bacterium]|jgi:hypothetical protein